MYFFQIRMSGRCGICTDEVYRCLFSYNIPPHVEEYSICAGAATCCAPLNYGLYDPVIRPSLTGHGFFW